MYSTVYSGALSGMHSVLVQVEADVAQGIPCLELVGCLSSEAREAKERVRVSLKNAGINLPPMRMTVNLSPAGVRKEGTAFDLPIAAALLAAMGAFDKGGLRDMLLLGELGLNGEVKSVRGVLPIVMEARRRGIGRCLVPRDNVAEGAVVPGIEVSGIAHVLELLAYMRAGEAGRESILPSKHLSMEEIIREGGEHGREDFADVLGQDVVKRAAEVSAAGFHHMLIIGPPGAGKTMIGSRMPGILPPISEEEALEVSAVYSVAGLLEGKDKLMAKRPFRSPHHTLSGYALAGGGRIPRPGEVSLAHRGVLFLDELPEFRRETLDILRQPLEEKKIHLSRTSGTFVYPADFILVCAMNPCPCGHYPDRNRCTCSEPEVRKYLNRISGPVLDRMDLCVEAAPVGIREMQQQEHGESSAKIQERVLQARERQKERFLGTGYRFNSDIGSPDISRFCPLGKHQLRMLEQIFEKSGLSARAYHRILKVARTIADLDGSDSIEELHLSEAVFYRMGVQKYWGK